MGDDVLPATLELNGISLFGVDGEDLNLVQAVGFPNDNLAVL